MHVPRNPRFALDAIGLALAAALFTIATGLHPPWWNLCLGVEHPLCSSPFLISWQQARRGLSMRPRQFLRAGTGTRHGNIRLPGL